MRGTSAPKASKVFPSALLLGCRLDGVLAPGAWGRTRPRCSRRRQKGAVSGWGLGPRNLKPQLIDHDWSTTGWLRFPWRDRSRIFFIHAAYSPNLENPSLLKPEFLKAPEPKPSPAPEVLAKAPCPDLCTAAGGDRRMSFWGSRFRDASGQGEPQAEGYDRDYQGRTTGRCKLL